MKREFRDENHHHNSSSNAMLPNLHHQSHKFHLHSPPHLRHSATASDEIDSHSQSPSKPNHAKDNNAASFPPPPPQPSSDGATIEVVRRPRGRPPGSKNKPKPPVIITRDASEQPSMSPYVLELPAGVDVVESTARFCRKRNIGLCVLNGNGLVSNVTLKQPSTTPGATVTFHGRFDILSLSATILPPGAAAAGNAPFTISLAGPQGQVVGGVVVGPLVAAGTIYLIAATFNNPSFDRLPSTPDHEDSSARDGEGESPQTVSGGGSGGAAPIYSYQPADVIWAPTARQPQQAPPY